MKKKRVDERGGLSFVRGILGKLICEQTTDDGVSIWKWKKKRQSIIFQQKAQKGGGVELFYYISFVMLHESLKVRTKAPDDEDVDKLDR